MRCSKCHGLVVNEYDDIRCVNCGCRPFEVPRHPEKAPQWQGSVKPECSNEEEG